MKSNHMDRQASWLGEINSGSTEYCALDACNIRYREKVHPAHWVAIDYDCLSRDLQSKLPPLAEQEIKRGRADFSQVRRAEYRVGDRAIAATQEWVKLRAPSKLFQQPVRPKTPANRKRARETPCCQRQGPRCCLQRPRGQNVDAAMEYRLPYPRTRTVEKQLWKRRQEREAQSSRKAMHQGQLRRWTS